MYWFKYAVFLAFSLPVAWLLESGEPAWLLDWPGSGWLDRRAAVAATLEVVLIALGSRFADVLSTLFALTSPKLHEGAPNVGPRPEFRQLFALAMAQLLAIVVIVLAVELATSRSARLFCLVVALVSWCAVVQNIILLISHDEKPERLPDRRTHADGTPAVADEASSAGTGSAFDLLMSALYTFVAVALALPLSAVIVGLLLTDPIARVATLLVIAFVTVSFAAADQSREA
jgi:hypothetical protein